MQETPFDFICSRSGGRARESSGKRLVCRRKRNLCNADFEIVSERYNGNIFELAANMSSEGGEGRVDNETVMEFVKCGYETRWFRQSGKSMLKKQS